MPDRISEDMPGRMPEDMTDRMPEDMPDKMPEDMSDRMPEDLPVTKRIDVMVWITRSKVISSHHWHLMVTSCRFGSQDLVDFLLDSHAVARMLQRCGTCLPCTKRMICPGVVESFSTV